MKNAIDSLRIVTYPDMSELPADRLDQNVDQQRRVWGTSQEKGGLSEYVICKNTEKCGALQSIETVWKDRAQEPLHKLEKDVSHYPPCPECGSASELFLERENFRRLLEFYFKNAFGTVILDSQNKMRGSNDAAMGSYEELLASLNYRQSFDIAKCMRNTPKSIIKTPDSPVVLYNKTFIDPDLQGTEWFAKMTQALFALHPEYNHLPVITETGLHAKVHSIYKAQGWHELAEDRFGHTIFLLDSYARMRELVNLSRNTYRRLFGTEIEKWRRKRDEYLAGKGLIEKRKKYTGIITLPKVVQSLKEMGLIEASDDYIEAKDGTKYKIEHLTSEEITPEFLQSATDFFRERFNNRFGKNEWGQLFVFLSTGKLVSPQKFFQTEKDVPLKKMDLIPEEKYPIDPKTTEQAVLFHDPEMTLEKLTEKLIKNAHITYFEDEKGKLQGINFGYGCTLREAFEREWQHPCMYAKKEHQDPRLKKSFSEFLEKNKGAISKMIGIPESEINENTEVFVSNCVIVHPDLQQQGILFPLMTSYHSKIPKHLRDVALVGEAQKESGFLRILESTGLTKVDCLDSSSVLTVGHHGDFIEKFKNLAQKLQKND